MKPVTVLALCLASSVAASAVTSLLLAPDPGPAKDAGLAGHELALEATLARMEERQAALDARVASLASRDLAPPPSARISLGEIDAAVRRVLAGEAERSGAAEAGAALEGAGGAGKVAGALDLDAALEELLARGFDSDQEIWNELREAGLVDEAVAWFEARAAEHPGDPDAQVDVGEAYLQKIFEVGSGPLAGEWAMKADSAFDRALAIDDRHWEARFTKAVSLSNWPAFLGKQPEAIRHFETLIGQQQHQPPQSGFAETHLILGNMYQQIGKPDKARAAWQQGYALYPDSEALKKQLELTDEGGGGY